MSKTPIHHESARSNPFIVKSISKSLLTPCRQVGLSRKRKTPNSSNNSFSESFTGSSSLSSSLETTPVSSNSLLINTQNESTVTSEQRGNTKVKKKARVSKCLITEVESSESSKLENLNKKQCLPDLSDDEPLILKTKNNNFDMDQEVTPSDKNKRSPEISPKVMKNDNKTEVKLRKSPRKNKQVKILSDEEDEFIESFNWRNTQKIKQVSHTIEDFEKSTKHDSNIDKEHKEKCHVVELSPKSKKGEAKPIKSKLSSRSKINGFDTAAEKSIKEKQKKKNVSVYKINEDIANTEIKSQKKETEVEVTTGGTNHQEDNNKSASVLEDVTNGQKSHSSGKSVISDHDYYVKSKTKTKKIRRSLSLKKSSSEDKDYTEDIPLKECLITLTPLNFSNDLIDKPPSTEDIKNLEKQIKEKRKILDDLKQAGIYQKKHDLKELEELTARWKMGCISALNDLLPQLQTHVSIDMATLLKNLNIPPEMIALSQDGNLM